MLKCTEKAPLIGSEVNQGGSWIKLWDAAMDLALATQTKAFTRMLAHHQRGLKPSPLCEENNFNLSSIDHLATLTAST